MGEAKLGICLCPDRWFNQFWDNFTSNRKQNHCNILVLLIKVKMILGYHFGGVYIYKSESRSHARAKCYGMTYKKQVCQKSWVNSMKNAPQQSKSDIGQLPSNFFFKLCPPNIGMWGVYPEAMVGNDGRFFSNFKLGEHIWR